MQQTARPGAPLSLSRFYDCPLIVLSSRFFFSLAILAYCSGLHPDQHNPRLFFLSLFLLLSPSSSDAFPFFTISPARFFRYPTPTPFPFLTPRILEPLQFLPFPGLPPAGISPSTTAFLESRNTLTFIAPWSLQFAMEFHSPFFAWHPAIRRSLIFPFHPHSLPSPLGSPPIFHGLYEAHSHPPLMCFSS